MEDREDEDGPPEASFRSTLVYLLTILAGVALLALGVGWLLAKR